MMLVPSLRAALLIFGKHLVKARVITDPKDVFYFAWTPLFERASVVVVDTGGVMSHAAIVAREYGIPAVMGALDGTTIIRTGERVRVNGTSGEVFKIN